MSQYLRSCWFGRRVHPVGLILSAWSAYSAWLILSGGALGRLLDGPLGVAIATVQLAAAGLLWAGWWVRRRDWLMSGLLWAGAGIVAVSGAIIGETLRPDPSAIFGLLIAALAGWAWQLEREDSGGRQE